MGQQFFDGITGSVKGIFSLGNKGKQEQYNAKYLKYPMQSDLDYKSKYLKYKQKYLQLKQLKK